KRWPRRLRRQRGLRVLPLLAGVAASHRPVTGASSEPNGRSPGGRPARLAPHLRRCDLPARRGQGVRHWRVTLGRWRGQSRGLDVRRAIAHVAASSRRAGLAGHRHDRLRPGDEAGVLADPERAACRLRSGQELLERAGISRQGGRVHPARHMVAHPGRPTLLVVGGGKTTMFDISRSYASVQPLTTTGGDAVVNAQGPGLVYDPTTDRIVSWAGGGDVYSLDLA